MNRRKSDILKPLNFNSTLGEIIRILYSIALDHCILRSIDREKILGLTKDQLVALLERGYSESIVDDLFALAEKKAFKPLNSEELAIELADIDVLAISEECGKIMKSSEANAIIEPDYPSWWGAPLPLALLFKGGIIINETANNLPISKSLLHIKTASLPLKQKEFYVTLKENKKSHSVLFKQLEKRVYLIEDVTQDVETAGDIVWWASVGKAYASKIENDGKIMARDGEETEQFEIEEEIQCDWDGKNIGKLRIGRRIEQPKAPKRSKKK
ncbi:MAG: hypothetical protein FWE49_06545 [Synergistaceae bacterium]|nr:hypothetical protein [Synergistaceae bacterium]